MLYTRICTGIINPQKKPESENKPRRSSWTDVKILVNGKPPSLPFLIYVDQSTHAVSKVHRTPTCVREHSPVDPALLSPRRPSLSSRPPPSQWSVKDAQRRKLRNQRGLTELELKPRHSSAVQMIHVL
ncbi:unnamed protein product [Arctogadus glacialis]